MILEQEINRSISNNTYDKKVQFYTESLFSIVKKQVKQFPEWSLG
jgi:hypothetical protein